MRFVSFFKLYAVVALLSGCAIHRAEQEKHIAYLSAGVIPEKGISGRDVALRGNLAASAAKGSGSDIGMAALMLINSGNFQKIASKYDHLEVRMPIAEAANEQEAALRMSQILEKAILQTLSGDYKARVDEYENEAVFGSLDKTRFIRVDGAGCENESCVIFSSLPTQTASTRTGAMIKYDHQTLVGGNLCPCYMYEGLQGAVVLSKIIREYDEKGTMNGHWHRFETKPISLGDDELYTRLSANLPDWAYYYVAKQPLGTDMKVPALFNKGKRVN